MKLQSDHSKTAHLHGSNVTTQGDSGNKNAFKKLRHASFHVKLLFKDELSLKFTFLLKLCWCPFHTAVTRFDSMIIRQHQGVQGR